MRVSDIKAEMKIFDIKNRRTYVGILFLFTVLFTLPHFLSVFTVSEEEAAGAGMIGMEKEREDPFQNLSLQGKAFFVYDIKENNALYVKNEETQFPLASLTKVMTALIAEELSPEGMLITIDSNALETEGDSGLVIGERWLLKDIIDLTLVSSSNDGARAIASVGNFASQDENTPPEEYFVRHMNRKARSIGLQQTYFLNESGLDVNSKALRARMDLPKTWHFFLLTSWSTTRNFWKQRPRAHCVPVRLMPSMSQATPMFPPAVFPGSWLQRQDLPNWPEAISWWHLKRGLRGLL